MTASRKADVMQRLESLQVTPVWVNPNHIVSSARVLMDGHDLSAICVLDSEGRPVGLLRRDMATNIPNNARVDDVMEPIEGVLQTSDTLRQAADLMVSIKRHYAPMMNGEEFRGVVTAFDLLNGLRRSWDPMTDLPWSDELRRWGADQLDSGHEIAVIFIDLDRFGTFNRRFGHVIGDRVLRQMARFLSEWIDTDRDILVRYGGDEFAIGTLRSGNETQDLADSLLESSRETPLTESGESISFSVGVYGGQRQRERDDMHVQATLDDLINLASRRCIASKAASDEAAQSVTAVAPAPVQEAQQDEPKDEETPSTPDPTPIEEAAPVAEAPSEATSVEVASVEEAAVEESSVEEAPVEETPVESTPLEVTRTEETSAEDATPLPAFMARPTREPEVATPPPVVPEMPVEPEVPVAAAPAAEAQSTEGIPSAPESLTAADVAPVVDEPSSTEEVTVENMSAATVAIPVTEAPPIITTEAVAVPDAPTEVTAPVAEAPQTAPVAAVAPPVVEVPSVIEVQIEDDPNSLTHVVLKGSGRVWVGVGLRLGRTLESTVAYATGKALERAYAGRTLRIDAVREEEGRFVVEGTRTENGKEQSVSALAEDNTPEAVADATIAAFLA